MNQFKNGFLSKGVLAFIVAAAIVILSPCQLIAAPSPPLADREGPCIWSPPSSAAGTSGGRHGANRVVHGKAGETIGGVKGNFEITSFSDGEPERHRTGPSYYVGLKSGDSAVTIDAGVQWARETWTHGDGSTRYGRWVIFFRASSHGGNGAWNPKDSSGDPVMIAQDELGNLGLSLEVDTDSTAGRVLFAVNGNYLHSMSQNVYWTNERSGRPKINGMQGRRVIAITQDPNPNGGPWHNNSFITCNFTDGSTARVYYANSTAKKVTLTWGNWSGPDSANAKDYNPTGKAMKGATDPQSLWAVDFGAPFTRNKDATGSQPNTSQELSRYKAESVIIRLLKGKAQANRKNSLKRKR